MAKLSKFRGFHLGVN